MKKAGVNRGKANNHKYIASNIAIPIRDPIKPSQKYLLYLLLLNRVSFKFQLVIM